MLPASSLTYLAAVGNAGLGCVESQEVQYSVHCINCPTEFEKSLEIQSPLQFLFVYLFSGSFAVA